MAGPFRVPPRFVPTLTSVVDPVAGPAPADGVRAPDAAWAPLSKPFVADVGKGEGDHVALSGPSPSPSQSLSEADAFRLEEQVLHRVLQRVDVSLEQRLTDAVSAAVQRQLDLMVPLLRREVEQVLRAVVIEALARELSHGIGSVPDQTPPSFG